MTQKNLTVATVFRTGGTYTRDYVEKLKRGFERHLPIPHKFVCLTDDVYADHCVPLKHDWPGWWAKIELFRPGLFDGPVIAVDLDTVLTGDLSALVQHEHPFVMMRDFQLPDRANSCLMYWEGDNSFIYETFLADPQHYQDIYYRTPMLGDQAMIEVCLMKRGDYPALWQDILPAGFLRNFQLEIEKQGTGWSGASLVWWTYVPKPHQLSFHPLIKEHWV